ncbi:hypothetical protein B296_00040400 [Ensete ventricosum]|uniref:Uncharacterized protein n=1 Tax=Ensete ventricosum TaxID=4639 RepID=A0A426XQ34_ENSVE|nr:hypothetical protein B296_00040400 [Ensete ventricosum]
MRLSLAHDHQHMIVACVASTRMWPSLDAAFTQAQPPLMRLLLHVATASRLWQSLPTRGRRWMRLLPTRSAQLPAWIVTSMATMDALSY